ncbi:SRPBCC family protein [Nocardia nepalensis]|uniref:SRPBCC family protein n=1 Tax=Nocardia nepalensis TaxID=3375448 RepID=UPI003B67490B
MPSAERTITINRPIADVFAFFADAENDPQWRGAVKEIKRDGPLQVGARYHQVVVGPGGRGIPADIKVTKYLPTSLVSFQVIAGPVRPEGVYRFREAGSATEVTFSLHVELSWLKKVMSKAVQQSMDSEMADLDTAKRILETPA